MVSIDLMLVSIGVIVTLQKFNSKVIISLHCLETVQSNAGKLVHLLTLYPNMYTIRLVSAVANHIGNVFCQLYMLGGLNLFAVDSPRVA